MKKTQWNDHRSEASLPTPHASDRGARPRRLWFVSISLLAVCLLGGLLVLKPASSLPREESRPDSSTPTVSYVEFDRFSARRERTGDDERLTVSLRLRTTSDRDLDCFVFVVARNDQATPKLWSIWPPQTPGPAISTAGHFHGARPSAGHKISLTRQWERVTASVAEPNTNEQFRFIVVYVLNEQGRVLLARPFRI